MATVRVRIALAIDSDGKWWAYGYHNSTVTDAQEVICDMSEDGNDTTVWKWIEADVEIPQEEVVAGAAVDAEPPHA